MKEFNGTQMTGSTGSTGSWVSVKEYAELTGKSRQAVLKGISKGKYKTREVSGRGKGGVAYEIWYALTTTDNQSTDNLPLTTSRLTTCH